MKNADQNGFSSAFGKTRALGYHSRPEVKIVNLRVMLFATMTTMVLSSIGCFQGPSTEPSPSTNERSGRTQAGESGRAKPQTQWWQDQVITEKLELTDDQIQAISDLMAVSSGDDNQHRQQERQMSLRYLRALDQNPYDPELVERASERLINVLSSKDRQRIENVRALRDILTHEQWTTLWNVAPRALQISGFRVLRGPKISVSNADESPTTPTP